MTVFGLIAMVLALLFLRLPIYVVLGAAVVYVYLAWGSGFPVDIYHDMYGALDHDLFLAVPLFILAGSIMSRGTLATKLIDFASEIAAPLPGGLVVAGILSCSFFAAISGSSIVTMLAVGTVLYPALVAKGYDRGTSIGALTSAGSLGIIIPPSIPLILFGLVTQTSITDLFLAAIFPGLLIAGGLVCYVLWRCRDMERRSWNPGRQWKMTRRSALALMMPVVVLGGIYSGYFTATESAGIAVVYALVVEGLVYREVTARDLALALEDTVLRLGTITPILALAVSLNQFLAMEGIPNQLVALVQDLASNKLAFLAVVNLVLLGIGCVMDIASAIMLLAPLLTPIAITMGIHPIHFGIIMIVNLELGYLTPPMGLNLFVASSAFQAELATVIRAVLPFFLSMLLSLIVISLVPEISLTLVQP